MVLSPAWMPKATPHQHVLKKALTPAFVSGIIKDTDFEVDAKEIKDYAITIIEDVYGTKNPVENLQARIRRHFVK